MIMLTDEEIMKMCFEEADRSPDERLKVGCIITDKKGYLCVKSHNGVIQNYYIKSINWDDTNQKNDCMIHAEMKAIINNPEHHANGLTLYCTDEPCWNCAKLIVAAGIEKVVYVRPYQSIGHTSGSKILLDAGITIRKLPWQL